MSAASPVNHETASGIIFSLNVALQGEIQMNPEKKMEKKISCYSQASQERCISTSIGGDLLLLSGGAVRRESLRETRKR